MKAKILGLMTLSILAFVFLVGLTSALVTFDPSSFSQTVEQGASTTLSFQIEENDFGALTGITFNTPVTFTSGSNTFNSANTVSGAVSTLAQNATSGTMSLTINVPDHQPVGTYTGILSLTDATYSLVIHNLSITLTVTEKQRPSEINDCLAIGDSGNLMRLEIEEIKIVSGFGDEDTEWVPLDEVEVEVKIENNNNDYKIEDVEISWGLYNLDKQEWVFDEEESDFNLKDGDDKTFFFTFELEDPDDFEDSDTYAFYVWAEGEDEENNNELVCEFVSEDIDVIVESDFLILGNLQIEGIDLEDSRYPDKLSCGSTLQFTADVWNIGEDDQEDIEVRVYNNDFGIDEILEIGDVDSFDSESISFEFTIPEGMEEGWNTLELTIQEDGDIFENDYTDDDAEFEVLLDLENCLLAQALVSAALDEGGKAGQDLVVRATITNPGDESTTYVVNAYGYAEWASTAEVSPSTFVLEAGQSIDVLITLNVDRDVSGERLFNIEVLSEGELVVSQPLSVNVEKALVGDLFGDNGLVTALIIGIAIDLIVIIIVLAIRVARK